MYAVVLAPTLTVPLVVAVPSTSLSCVTNGRLMPLWFMLIVPPASVQKPRLVDMATVPPLMFIVERNGFVVELAVSSEYACWSSVAPGLIVHVVVFAAPSMSTVLHWNDVEPVTVASPFCTIVPVGWPGMMYGAVVISPPA